MSWDIVWMSAALGQCASLFLYQKHCSLAQHRELRIMLLYFGYLLRRNCPTRNSRSTIRWRNFPFLPCQKQTKPVLLLCIEGLKACLSGFPASLRPSIIFSVCRMCDICEALKQTLAFRFGSCCGWGFCSQNLPSSVTLSDHLSASKWAEDGEACEEC